MAITFTSEIPNQSKWISSYLLKIFDSKNQL